ncbi:hypothetical protein LOY35_17795 [Pseudomonas sp. B21-028]|uniref:hypothetical protein n=1 Tax=Pseudomonas sp. B21-028 TaxID=2895480 RepID=UPI00216039D8|nr:hypothetical protein [Pseudomonas sp. B21-028]UVL82074.1 hypothetical protein LOY35_17795 [Pseudomonas sp. B21-028]
MKKLALIVGAVFLIVASILFWIHQKGQEIIREGELDTRWIRLEMWPVPYFNQVGDRLAQEEENFLRVISDKYDKEEVLGYLSRNKCKDVSDACTTNLLTLVVVLLGEQEFDRAKGLLNQAARNTEAGKVCPIKLELSILKSIVEVMRGESISGARGRAEQTIKVLESSRGINAKLQTPACNELVKQKPELFHAYVMQVAEVMSFAGGSLSESAAYLRKVNKVR